MGAMHFAIPDRSHLPSGAVARAYMAGMEGIPWHCETSEIQGGFRLERKLSESGELYLPWCVEGFGEVMLSTSTLLERPKPYQLPLELARGTVNRLRNQLATWLSMGFDPPAGADDDMHAVLAALAAAATEQHSPGESAQHAQQALERGLRLTLKLGDAYSTQALAARQRKLKKLPTILAGNLENRPLSEADAKLFKKAFNTTVVPMNWHHLEPNEGEHAWTRPDRQYAWAAATNMRVMAGPLLELTQRKMPDWLSLWDDDPHAMQSFLAQHIAAVVERYAERTSLWHAMSRVNLSDLPSLSDEDHLRMAVAVLETLRQIDGRTPAIVSFDQPWAEYVGAEAIDLSPLHFADALARADLGLSGLGLEINLGYWPNGTQARDMLELGRHLDRWAALGLPLVLFLTAPSSQSEDPHCRGESQAVGGLFEPEQHARWVKSTVQFLLAKPAVQGIVWNQTHDRYGHEFPHGGLFDTEGQPKPALAALTELRKQYLN